MSMISTSDPLFRSALDACVNTLRRLANYQLDAALEERLQDLGERKEVLGEREHQFLMALIGFTQQRTREKLEAELALRRLQEAIPEL